MRTPEQVAETLSHYDKRCKAARDEFVQVICSDRTETAKEIRENLQLAWDNNPDDFTGYAISVRQLMEQLAEELDGVKRE